MLVRGVEEIGEGGELLVSVKVRRRRRVIPS